MHRNRYLEMIRSAAVSFPENVSKPPPEAASTGPSLNLNLPGGVNVSLGGPAGTGVYRTGSDAVGIQADGIKEGVKGLLGKVKQGVDQIRIP
jgi:vacuolar protein sorting-associated protein 45